HEPGKGRVFRQETDGPLESGHIVVFPDRYMLVEVADQRVPPTDQPAAGLPKERQPRLFNEPVLVRPFIRLDPNPPFAINPVCASSRRRSRLAPTFVAARRRDECGQYDEKPRQLVWSKHDGTPWVWGEGESFRSTSLGRGLPQPASSYEPLRCPAKGFPWGNPRILGS